MRIIYFFMISIAELMYDYATRIQHTTEIQRKRPVKNWSCMFIPTHQTKSAHPLHKNDDA